VLLSKAQLRCMDCIRTGFFIHGFDNVRFLTLTSAENMNFDLRFCFDRFVKEIRKTRIKDLIDRGYLDIERFNDFYPDDDYNDFLRFEYIAVKTSEGVSGVYHILFVGNFIPYRFIGDIWYKITGSAKVVDVRFVKDIVKVSDYIVLQQSKILGYVSGQSKYKRFSYSKGWVFDGYSNCYSKFFSDFWHKELLRINELKGFVDKPFDLYNEIFVKLSKDEKNEFFKKRWSEWINYIKLLGV